MEPLTHKTRRESNEKTDRETRYKKILAVLEPGIEMTAREIAYALRYNDLNAVKPRLTELRGLGKVLAVGKKYDKITDRNVTIYKRKED